MATIALKRMISAPVDKEALTRELVAAVEKMLPVIRERGPIDERNGRISDDTIREMDEAKIFELLVPGVYGGHGLGLAALYEMVRTIARGDMATAWIASFIIEHNWWAGRMPLKAQEEMFAGRTNVKIATAQSPMATAVRVTGGYRVTGKYPYSSAILWSDYCIYPGRLVEETPKMPMQFLIPIEDVKILDDWDVTGMQATGSRTGVVEDVFVPEHRAISNIEFFGSKHPGIVHEEPIYRARLMESLAMQMAALAVGGAEAMVELGRERLYTSAPFGTKRIDRTASQMRWGAAAQKVRMATALFEDGVQRAVAKEQSGSDWTEEERGQNEFDVVTIMHSCKEAVQMLVDGAGSSAFQRNYPMQRFLRDIQMISTHVLASDYDVIAERATRLILGLGRTKSDPQIAP